jgi:hypothetical protein
VKVRSAALLELQFPDPRKVPVLTIHPLLPGLEVFLPSFRVIRPFFMIGKGNKGYLFWFIFFLIY